MHSNLSENYQPDRVLCADDGTLVGELLGKLFSVNGYECTRVRDGEAALQCVSQDVSRYTVMIVEHKMPKLGELALARLARRAGFYGRIIVHGASMAGEDASEYEALGVELVERGDPDQGLLRVMERFHGEE
ncbi:MAG: response regulator [Opitutaceae bacterium]|nr:response regulator [Opitutaceae bacterium]